MEGSTERKDHRSSKCLRNKPEGLDIILKNNEVERAFKQVGGWKFSEKLSYCAFCNTLFYVLQYLALLLRNQKEFNVQNVFYCPLLIIYSGMNV